jgi:hypothetical protein
MIVETIRLSRQLYRKVKGLANLLEEDEDIQAIIENALVLYAKIQVIKGCGQSGFCNFCNKDDACKSSK